MKMQPPAWLDPLARNAYFNLYEHHARRGTWDPVYASFLVVAAVTCAQYVTRARAYAPCPMMRRLAAYTGNSWKRIAMRPAKALCKPGAYRALRAGPGQVT
jgi:hypothetical protein